VSQNIEPSLDPNRIVWIDLEMTGLDPLIDEVIEIATIITDNELNVIAIGPELILHQCKSRWDKMDEWNRNQHGKSGLWDKVLSSEITCKQAEEQTLAFIKQYVPPKAVPLAGNSVWQDRRFLNRYMPSIDEYLHYRIIDVSTIKECVSRWYPSPKVFVKKESHRAIDDIKESIEELSFFRQHYFQSP
jgi:oligoribonuclease